MKNETGPPRWASRLLTWFCNDHLADAVLGDLTELYFRRRRTMSKRKADFLFAAGIFQFIQPFALKRSTKIYHPTATDMFKNYFKTAWRSMTRQKLYSGIKIGGFAVGLATCVMIFLFIRAELSVEQKFTDEKQVYRIYNEFSQDGALWTSFPANMASLVKADFPEVEMSARFIPWKWFNAGNNLIRRDDKPENTYEEGFAYADPQLLEVLEIPMIKGSPQSALRAVRSIVLSKKMSDKYFPNEDPIGKVMILNEDKAKPFVVGGVMEDFPSTSHLHYEFLITLTGVEFWPGEQTSWCCWNYSVYVKLRPDADPGALETKMLSIRDKHYLTYLQQSGGDASMSDVRNYHHFRLQKVRDIYLSTLKIDDELKHGDARYTWMFGAIAIFILLLACINFINLSTAKSANRAREVGMRKVLGSFRSFLVRQFLTESLAYSVLSFLIAIILVIITLPWFSSLAGKEISLPLATWWFVPSLVCAAFVVGIVAGLYPAFYLSSFKPVDVLKGKVSRGTRTSSLRGAMVVFQFATSIILIIGTYVIQRQMNYVLTTKVGFEKDQVVQIHGANTLNEQHAAFKNELLAQAGIERVTINNYLPVPGTNRDNNGFWLEGRTKIDKSVGAQRWICDEDYIPALGIKLTEGRNFDPKIASDSSAIIINQTMAKEMGLKHPLGARLTNWSTWTVIGVMEDFNFESMRQSIRPLGICFGHGGSVVSVKTQSKNTASVIAAMEKVWKQFMPNQPFRYSFMNESYARMYDDVRRTGTIFASFAGLAILVACLGLFALSAFMVEQRSKEISVRLVLGASVSSIFTLLTKNFVKLVLIAFVIAVPVSYLMMQKWLEDYTYKTTITADVFILSGTLSVMIALLTVGYQSLRAAMANPAQSLRAE